MAHRFEILGGLNWPPDRANLNPWPSLAANNAHVLFVSVRGKDDRVHFGRIETFGTHNGNAHEGSFQWLSGHDNGSNCGTAQCLPNRNKQLRVASGAINRDSLDSFVPTA